MYTERFRGPAFADRLAIFIMRTSDGTHTGLLFKVDGNHFIQDLCWHEMFHSAVCEHPHYFVMPALEEEEENDVSGVCRLIHNRHNSADANEKYRIPYAFDGGNARIDGTTGELFLEKGFGLTCSSYVLKVFEVAAIQPIDLTGWKSRPDDKTRHEALLKKMETGIPEYNIPPADPEHIEAVRGQLDCIRVRPEEVASFGILDREPVPSQEQLEPAGTWLLRQLPAA